MKPAPVWAPSEDRAWLERMERARRTGAEGVPLLIEMLTAANWAQRRRVIAELATLGDAALKPLCSVLEQQRADETKNAAAMDALAASVGDALPHLLRLASHPDPAIAADAAQILGRRRERDAVPALGKLATGKDDNVATAAVEALGRIGGRGAVETLIILVRSGDFFRTFPAIDVLGRSGDPRAVAPLAGLLQDPRYGLEAMRALSRTADRAAVRPLAAMLTHASATHVRVAAAALADLADAYQERYGDGYLIGAALEQAAAPGALRALTKALVGADGAESVAIARVLGMLRNPEAVAVLGSLVDGPPATAKAAVSALEALGPRVADQLLELLRKGDSARRAIVLPLISSGMNAADDVLRCLGDPDGNVRILAAQALGRTGAVKFVGALFPLLEDPNARVVQAAVGAIQALGGAEAQELTLQAAHAAAPRVQREALRIARYFGYQAALPIALSLLEAEDERLREAAIMTLSAIDEPEAMRAIVQQAAAPDEKTRAMAMRAIGQAARCEAGVHALLTGTRDRDAWVRYYAAQSLGRLGIVDALSALAELLTDGAAQVRISAVEALSHLPCAKAFEALREASKSDEPDVRRAAVLGFGTLKHPDAVSILLAALESPDAATRLVAASALGHFDDREAVMALGRAANDPEENVRLTAIGILAEMSSAEATLSLVRLVPEYRELDRVRLALSAAFPGRIEGISSALADADDETAAVLTSALVRMRTPESAAALLRSLSLPNVEAGAKALLKAYHQGNIAPAGARIALAQLIIAAGGNISDDLALAYAELLAEAGDLREEDHYAIMLRMRLTDRMPNAPDIRLMLKAVPRLEVPTDPRLRPTFTLVRFVQVFIAIREHDGASVAKLARDALLLLEEVRSAPEAQLSKALADGMREALTSIAEASLPSASIHTPFRKIGRNNIVTVRYRDGDVRRAKYKYVAQDLALGACTLVD